MVVGIPSRPSTLVTPSLATRSAVRVLDISDGILDEFVVVFDLKPEVERT